MNDIGRRLAIRREHKSLRKELSKLKGGSPAANARVHDRKSREGPGGVEKGLSSVRIVRRRGGEGRKISGKEAIPVKVPGPFEVRGESKEGGRP